MTITRLVTGYLCALTLSLAHADDVTGYDFPIKNAVKATVVGTPPAARHPFSQAKLREKYYLIDMEKPGLERFKAQRRRGAHRLEFSLAYQRKPAPLVVSIAGTGGDHASGKAKTMKNILFNAGYHVLSMTSPSNADFMFAASSANLAGMSTIDAKDLYAVIQAALERVGDRIDVTDYYLTGYSLGGLEAAFLAELDSREKQIGFSKVLLLNPPVNLYTSVSNLDAIATPDELVERTGSASLREFTDQLFDRVVDYFRKEGRMDLTGDALYKVVEGIELTDFEMRVLIRLAFALSTADMVYVADAMSQSGYIIPVGADLSFGSTVWFKRSMRWNFLDYFYKFVLPYWQSINPGDTEEDAIRKFSLTGIESYLSTETKVSVMHNRDDIILGPGDIEFLEQVMGSRATIYPTGGHLGSMDYQRNVDDMLAFFKE